MLERLDNCSYTLLVGRVLLASIYFFTSLGILSGNIPDYIFEMAATQGMPAFLVYIGFSLKFLAGLALIVGYQTRIAALALVVFTATTAFVFHIDNPMAFMKEISMIGGLLVLAVAGAGKFSFDARK